MRKKKAKMGRPVLPEEKRRSEVVNVRMTKAELAALEAEAHKTGATLSEVLMRPWRKEGR